VRSISVPQVEESSRTDLFYRGGIGEFDVQKSLNAGYDCENEFDKGIREIWFTRVTQIGGS
jgi:hypothetical protein